ncbi:MAG: VWA domain-containing protein [Spirochaetales bacterium]|nr:VWA domain-containing protein [Spirochaetales bacterium]
MKPKLFSRLFIFTTLLSLLIFSCASSEGIGSAANGNELVRGDVPDGDVDSGTDRVIDAPAEEKDSGGSDDFAAPGDSPAENSSVVPEKRKEAIEKEAESEPFFGIRAEEAMESPMPMMMEESEGDYSYSTSGSSREAAPSASGLKAGYSDDNRQYGYFIRFLEEFGQDVVPLKLDIAERIVLSVTDSNGKPIHGAEISISGKGVETTGRTHADGSWQFNPPSRSSGESYFATITPGEAYPGISQTFEIERDGPRNLDISIDTERVIPDPIPLDIVFVMDTTGSMGEEIERLKNTIQIIHMNLTALSIPAEVRFGMVLYKDVDDAYRTRVIPLTSDLDIFQQALNTVSAMGGGDTPEDLEAALDVLIHSMEWNPEAIQLAYIITDAPPHLDYNSDYTCSDAAIDARKQGLKIYGIGTGGLDLQGEYILRQIAQYTSARYIFLTYGSETGESSGGEAGSVSHHTGSNWNADKLESIIIRFAKEEISYLSDHPLEDDDPWFEAGLIETEEAEETLGSLFDQALEQLLDYSTFPVTERTPLAVLPFNFDGDSGATAEYFNEHFILSAGRSDRLSLAERKDISQILTELEFQNLGLTEEGSVGKIGEFLNAEILVTGNLFIKSEKYELFLKLLRTETGEVLSVTRAVIESGLGL